MPRATCPACGKGFRLEGDEAVLYGRVYCPNCDAQLEVIDENPVMLEELED
jgi:lysine biosynthesis protein LysW